jgi:dipeptide/tripeptide permease
MPRQTEQWNVMTPHVATFIALLKFSDFSQIFSEKIEIRENMVVSVILMSKLPCFFLAEFQQKKSSNKVFKKSLE